MLGVAFTCLRKPRANREITKDLLVVAAYVPLAIGFFWQIIFETGVHLSRGQGDLASFSFPVLSFVANSLQQGVFPLWNPYLYGGHPIFADAAAAIFYPFNVLAAMWSAPFTFDAIEQLVVMHVVLAAVFTYAYARVLSLGRLAAFTAGMLFAFGGFSTSRLDSLNTIEGLAWVPLLVLLFHLALDKRSLVLGALAGGAYGLLILAGNLQLVFYAGVLLAVYWLWAILYSSVCEWSRRATSSRPVRDVDRHYYRRIAVLPICLLAAGGIAAVQMIPLLQLMGLSLNHETTLAIAAGRLGGPEHILTLAVPYLFAENLGGLWGFSAKVREFYGYVGLIPLFLAGVGAWSWKRYSWCVLLLGVLAIASLLLGVLEPLVLYRLLLRFVPGFAKSSSSAHLVVIFDFAVAVLAAQGLDSMTSARGPRPRRVGLVLMITSAICLFGGILLGGYLYNALIVVRSQSLEQVQEAAAATDSLGLTVLFLLVGFATFSVYRYSGRHRQAVPMILAVVFAADLFGANSGFNISSQDLFAKANRAELAAFLKQGLGEGRIDTMTGVADVWEQSSAMNAGLPDVMGPSNPLMLGAYYEFWENLGARSGRAYDLLGVKYVLTHGSAPLDPEKFRAVPAKDNIIKVYENMSAVSRAMLVPSAEVLSHGDTIARLKSPGFDPRETVLLEDKVAAMTGVNGSESAGKVLSVEFPSPNEVRLMVSASEPAFLVLNDAYYPGWRAYVDDREVPIYRANYTFRAVETPQGDHRVRMMFEPTTLALGGAVSAASLFCLLLAGVGATIASTRAVAPGTATAEVR